MQKILLQIENLQRFGPNYNPKTENYKALVLITI
jgi:hypothetical protein